MLHYKRRFWFTLLHSCTALFIFVFIDDFHFVFLRSVSFLLANIDNAGCVYFFIFVLTIIIHTYCKLHKSQCTILHPVFSFGVFFIIKIHLYSSCLRRSYNILKEVKCPQDIDNTHVTSLIERKMTKDDMKIWARHIHSQKLEPSMKNLLKWMDEKWLQGLDLEQRYAKLAVPLVPLSIYWVLMEMGIPLVNVTKIRSSAMYVKQVSTLMHAHNLKQWCLMNSGRLLSIKKSVFHVWTVVKVIHPQIACAERHVLKRIAMAKHVRSPTINSCTCTVEKHLVQYKSPCYRTRVWRYFR